MLTPRVPHRLVLVVLAALFAFAAAPLVTGAATPQPIATFARDGHVLGMDASHWQGKVIWKRVRADGVRFAIVKATEAQRFVDPQYSRNRDRAANQGVFVGAYHFAQPDGSHRDAIREADHFVDTARLRGGDLVPVLDLEVTGGLRPWALIRWARAWLQRVESRLGVKPMIYTSPHFWRDNLNDSRWFADNGYRLWIAHWRAKEPMVPAANWGGRGYSLWQVSDCGGVTGIGGCVDVDLFRGKRLANMTIERNR